MNISMLKLHLTTMSVGRKVEFLMSLILIITLIIIMTFVKAAIAVGVVLIFVIIIYVFRLWRFLPSEKRHIRHELAAQQRKVLPSVSNSLPPFTLVPQSNIAVDSREGQSEVYLNNEPFPSSNATQNFNLTYPRVLTYQPQIHTYQQQHQQQPFQEGNILIESIDNMNSTNQNYEQHFQSETFVHPLFLESHLPQSLHNNVTNNNYNTYDNHLTAPLHYSNREPSQQTLPAMTAFNQNTHLEEVEQRNSHQIQWTQQSAEIDETQINHPYNNEFNNYSLDNQEMTEYDVEARDISDVDSHHYDDEEEKEEEEEENEEQEETEGRAFIEEDEAVYSRVIPWMNELHAVHVNTLANSNTNNNNNDYQPQYAADGKLNNVKNITHNSRTQIPLHGEKEEQENLHL